MGRVLGSLPEGLCHRPSLWAPFPHQMGQHLAVVGLLPDVPGSPSTHSSLTPEVLRPHL